MAFVMVGNWLFFGSSCFPTFYFGSWHLRNQWENCLARTRGMQFMVIHIYREGNNCIDRLADFWFNVADFKWWNVLLDFIRHDFNKYRIGFAFINIFDIALLWGFFFPLYGYCLFVFLSTLIIFGFA